MNIDFHPSWILVSSLTHHQSQAKNSPYHQSLLNVSYTFCSKTSSLRKTLFPCITLGGDCFFSTIALLPTRLEVGLVSSLFLIATSRRLSLFLLARPLSRFWIHGHAFVPRYSHLCTFLSLRLSTSDSLSCSLGMSALGISSLSVWSPPLFPQTCLSYFGHSVTCSQGRALHV